MIVKEQPVLNDKWFRFLGIPFIALMSHIIFYNRNDTGEQRFGFWVIYLISLTETYIVWEVIRLVIIYFRRQYPGIENSKKRIGATLLAGTVATILIRTANIFLYDKTKFWGNEFPVEGYLYSIFVALLYLFIVGGIYESIYYFSMWKNAALEAEALRNENLQTQLDSLIAQINPHFLFNNLSSLASLISEDPAKAEEFVNELSSVYRYLLQSTETGLITVENELAFIQAYNHLLQIRFGDAFQVTTAVDSKYLSYYLPPLTLQLLVENAVKHNITQKQKPLRIKIYTDTANKLIVENNIQVKNTPIISSRTGLKNISSKYRLMKFGDIAITKDDHCFRVAVPLIKYKPCIS